MAEIIEQTAQSERAAESRRLRMTAAMREGLDALQREYDAFVELSFNATAGQTPVGMS